MKLRAGEIRKIYDVSNGKRILGLQDLYPSQNLAASTFDAFKNVSYQIQNLIPTQSMMKELETPRVVTFYPNGDSYHTGLSVSVTRKKFPTLTKVFRTSLSNVIALGYTQ
jgi:hypothetical protein